MIQVTNPGLKGMTTMSTAWAIVEAAKAGAADARKAADGFFPAAARAVGTGFHATGFALGYAFTFPAYLAASVVPRNNAIVYGLTDGGRAGVDLARSTIHGDAHDVTNASLEDSIPALAVAPA